MRSPLPFVVLGVLLMSREGSFASCPPPPDGIHTLATNVQEAVVAPTNQPTGASRALELSLCPVAGSSQDPFLVQVLTRSASVGAQRPDQALGIVSFLPLKKGVAQRFVVPFSKPDTDGNDYSVVIRLISPSADRALANSAVAVIGAKFAE